MPSPVMTATETGRIARVEEFTRCLPEVQDALVPVLSERRIAVPELGEHSVAAIEGFGVIATANLRDKGVSEMSAALKRRFNFELVEPISDAEAEIALVADRTKAALDRAGIIADVDDEVVSTLVTIFRDLRVGRTKEGWAVEKPGSVLSTAEAVSISSSIALAEAYFPGSAGAEALVEALVDGPDPDTMIFGVRHHSPACARAVVAAAEEWKPEAIAIELPAELAPLLPWLADPGTEAPVAVAVGGVRGMGLYPSADFSPELAILRWAHRAGVDVHCIDLPAGAAVDGGDGNGGGDGNAAGSAPLVDVADLIDQEAWETRVESLSVGAPSCRRARRWCRCRSCSPTLGRATTPATCPATRN